MLHLTNLTKTFGTLRALDNITLTFDRPAMVGVIGAQGSGKSTLMRLVGGWSDPTGGQILFGDRRVSGLGGAARRRWQGQCGRIFDQHNLVPRLDVVANLLQGAAVRRSSLATLFNLYSRADVHDAICALERLGLADRAATRAEDLTLNEQLRVAIARALMRDPAMILADDPTVGLCPHDARQLMQTLRRIQVEDRRLVITSFSSAEVARRHCDRVIGLRAGAVVFDGAPETLGPQEMQRIFGPLGALRPVASLTTRPPLDLAALVKPLPQREPASALPV